jgi:hypothetical protein
VIGQRTLDQTTKQADIIVWQSPKGEQKLQRGVRVVIGARAGTITDLATVGFPRNTDHYAFVLFDGETQTARFVLVDLAFVAFADFDRFRSRKIREIDRVLLDEKLTQDKIDRLPPVVEQPAQAVSPSPSKTSRITETPRKRRKNPRRESKSKTEQPQAPSAKRRKTSHKKVQQSAS